MKSKETNATRVIIGRVMPDEELTDAITELVEKYKVKSGLINVIGALKKFTIGYFNIDTKEYQFKTFEEPVELVSCMGNVAYKDGKPMVHLHFMVAREDYSILGGHLGQPSIVSVTGEVYIYETDETITRADEPQFDLSLLNL
ncbi:MAG: hypothetical protein BAJALOKI3v1_930010 [Promethearchaeota archaeon]|jgi:hypothetical protein|nr:MAG: hypothetical protein BAJALOKI3v1_930010 [Candidatus Lokiarchaeota archaeon]